mmetsp:Transcript_7504/g.33308  ORF Transcript_7504/g.33308 Transcript_7504/m.33308 type:complete len:113 (-) Transcript_7504:199-537(-)
MGHSSLKKLPFRSAFIKGNQLRKAAMSIHESSMPETSFELSQFQEQRIPRQNANTTQTESNAKPHKTEATGNKKGGRGAKAKQPPFYFSTTEGQKPHQEDAVFTTSSSETKT